MQTAREIIDDVRGLLAGDPVFLAGSLVASDTYGKSNAHHDVDIFCPSDIVLMVTTQKLIMSGFSFADRSERIWARWLLMGMKRWHTNSIRLLSPHGYEVNLVYKLTDGHPVTSLSQVLESFDFGLLSTGYDLKTNTFMDLRGFLFPGMDPMGPFPLMPNKRDNWRNGFISQYNGLREAGRYAKYVGYGYDLSLVKDDLHTGYMQAWLYLSNHFDAEKQQLGLIYETIAAYIDLDDIDGLAKASSLIDYSDSLDAIMAALE